ncbi:MAG: DUF5667 domain-containing protein [Thermoleophilia bacterium]
MAIAAASALLLFAGTTLAATGAQPDSWLYPLKQKTEEARVVLAYQGLGRARVEVGCADRRLDEIEEMVSRGKPEYVPGLILSYDDHMSRAKELIYEAAIRGEDTSELDNTMAMTIARHDDILRAVLDGLPDDVAAAVRLELGIVTPQESVIPAGGTQDGSSSTGGDSGWQGVPSSNQWTYPTEGGSTYGPAPSSGMNSGSSSSGGQDSDSSSTGGNSGWQGGPSSNQWTYPTESGSTYGPAPSSGMN